MTHIFKKIQELGRSLPLKSKILVKEPKIWNFLQINSTFWFFWKKFKNPWKISKYVSNFLLYASAIPLTVSLFLSPTFQFKIHHSPPKLKTDLHSRLNNKTKKKNTFKNHLQISWFFLSGKEWKHVLYKIKNKNKELFRLSEPNVIEANSINCNKFVAKIQKIFLFFFSSHDNNFANNLVLGHTR